ncbi:hypothetical protein [Phenylobacterium sp.]|jgi:hypothetical protein|uniref:hypothetical protein n=1 Tax=Phenylobacterium sp. TaxID=1871053 RepID=UPI002E2F0ACE|nr:hypothetical protein [Phenylobacterium sp.]HEX3367198.1 hypothetical protein [Phenylobacterium sp.]
MLKSIVLAAAAVALALPAAAQPRAWGPPTPNEQVGMHVGDTTANGSSTIVTDRTGTHPDGYTGMATINRASGSGAVRRHHRRHTASEPAPG